MASPGNKFDGLIRHCLAINPPSYANTDERRLSSTIEGVDLAPEWTNKVVLMLGCGDGFEVAYARLRGWLAMGVTFHPSEVSACVADAPVVPGDIHDLQYNDKSFDAVYSKETLEHSPCPILALLESNRVLKAGGEFFHLIADGWNKQREWYHWSCLPDWVWCDLFLKAGLLVERVIGYPDCDKRQFNNKAYAGRKIADRPIDMDCRDYKLMIGYGEA